MAGPVSAVPPREEVSSRPPYGPVGETGVGAVTVGGDASTVTDHALARDAPPHLVAVSEAVTGVPRHGQMAPALELEGAGLRAPPPCHDGARSPPPLLMEAVERERRRDTREPVPRLDRPVSPGGVAASVGREAAGPEGGLVAAGVVVTRNQWAQGPRPHPPKNLYATYKSWKRDVFPPFYIAPHLVTIERPEYWVSSVQA